VKIAPHKDDRLWMSGLLKTGLNDLDYLHADNSILIFFSWIA